MSKHVKPSPLKGKGTKYLKGLHWDNDIRSAVLWANDKMISLQGNYNEKEMDVLGKCLDILTEAFKDVMEPKEGKE